MSPVGGGGEGWQIPVKGLKEVIGRHGGKVQRVYDGGKRDREGGERKSKRGERPRRGGIEGEPF